MGARVCCLVIVHDDVTFLPHVVRSIGGMPVTVLVGKAPWNGPPGDWEGAKRVARELGADVLVGVWPDECSQRNAALERARSNGFTHALVLDSDEVLDHSLLDALLKIARSGVADVVRASLATYWKDTSHVVWPPEQIRPVVMVDVSLARCSGNREHVGHKGLVLGPDHGVVHHLSYVGPPSRIRRKLETFSHSAEVVPGWFERVWLGWDSDRFMTALHPTHPQAYGQAKRVSVPGVLKEVTCDEGPVTCPVPVDPWPGVSIVVPVFGGKAHLTRLAGWLAGCAGLIEEVVFVDDAGPEPVEDVIVSGVRTVHVKRERNGGFAAACNTGYGCCTGELVLFLNSDAGLTRPALVRLVQTHRALDATVTGPVGDNVGHFQRVPVSVDTSNLEEFATDFAHAGRQDGYVSMLSGFCMLVDKRAMEGLGGITEEFGTGFFEDNDLCYRVQRGGGRLAVSANSFVHHEGSQSLLRAVASPRVLLERNARLFEAKYKMDVECGFASHLPGERPEPIAFNRAREPQLVAAQRQEAVRRADIGLCMIVRDEERVIGDCLSSAKGWFTQTVVLDTGSTDRTVQIAMEHGAEVHTAEWQDSFSVARNISLSHCRTKWVMWMDADDTLPDWSAAMINQAVADAPEDVVGFVVPVRFTDQASGGTQVDHVKVFRNLPGVEFEGRIHEQVLPSLRRVGGRVERTGAVVLHSGYDTSPEGQKKKTERDERLLGLDLQDRPGHPFVLFNLGMTAHFAQRHAEAVDWLGQSIGRSGTQDSHVRKAYVLMGVSQRRLGDEEGALCTFDRGLSVVGPDPELLFQRALLHTESGRFSEARVDYEQMPTGQPQFFSSFDTGILGPKRLYNLGAVCDSSGDSRAAWHYFAEALRSDPKMVPAAEAMFRSALRAGNIGVAQRAAAHVESAEGASERWSAMMIEVWRGQGKDPAAELSRLVSNHGPHPGLRIALARCLLEQDRRGEAHGVLAGLESEGFAQAPYFAGVDAVRRGDMQGALGHFRRACELDPSHEETHREIQILEDAIRGENA